jgi:hypothetical protein
MLAIETSKQPCHTPRVLHIVLSHVVEGGIDDLSTASFRNLLKAQVRFLEEDCPYASDILFATCSRCAQTTLAS